MCRSGGNLLTYVFPRDWCQLLEACFGISSNVDMYMLQPFCYHKSPRAAELTAGHVFAVFLLLSWSCPYFKQGVKNKAFQVHKSFVASQVPILVFHAAYLGQRGHNMWEIVSFLQWLTLHILPMLVTHNPSADASRNWPGWNKTPFHLRLNGLCYGHFSCLVTFPWQCKLLTWSS